MASLGRSKEESTELGFELKSGEISQGGRDVCMCGVCVSVVCSFVRSVFA